jgi:hypothetical protein
MASHERRDMEGSYVICKPVAPEGLDILVGKEYIVIWRRGCQPKGKVRQTARHGSDLQERYALPGESW